MKRRNLLVGGVAGLGVAGVALWKPRDQGGPHDAYFARLNALLKAHGHGRPTMVIDLERLNHNIDTLMAGIGSKTYRVVVKSLPSLPLLQHVMQRANTRALMVFHQPFLNAVASRIPDADVLLGKPMPIAAVRTFYRREHHPRFVPAEQIQWLIDTPERLEQYLEFARSQGVHMRINLELDVGLHRGGFADHEELDGVLHRIAEHPHLSLAGFMGYEPHLAGVTDELSHPAVQTVLDVYRGFLARAGAQGVATDALTINGAGSHTIRLYDDDTVMNDLSAGSGLVKPSDFDTLNLSEQLPGVFIAAPILKRYDKLMIPGQELLADAMPLWDPNTARLYYLYGGYWKAGIVSPPGAQDWMYHSTNQSPVMTSTSVDLAVDDYMFLRPTQSEHVMLQFGDLFVFQGGEPAASWPVFHQTG